MSAKCGKKTFLNHCHFPKKALPIDLQKAPGVILDIFTELLHLIHILRTSGINGVPEVIPQHLIWIGVWTLQKVDFMSLRPF